VTETTAPGDTPIPAAGEDDTTMRTTILCAALAAAFLVGTAGVFASPADMPGLLPELAGWTREGEPETYTAETLFEYIDGAADLYLSYAFDELATASYSGGGKRSMTVEVYRHGGLRDAFGIYSQERPKNGRFVAIGTEGYYDTGVLNFFHGPYYVKITGFYLGESDEPTLTAAAEETAKRLGQTPKFPEVLAIFPTEGKITHSESYLAENVLGYGFLHSAYTADYTHVGEPTGEPPVRVFRFEGKDESDARKMFDAYVGMPKTEPAVVNDGIARFQDMLRSSMVPMNLRTRGRFVWGVFMNDAESARSIIEAIEKNLTEQRLVG